MCWWELGQVIIRFPAQDPAAGPGIVWIQHFKFGLTRGPSPSSLHMVLRVSVCSTPEYDKGPSFLPVVLPGAWYANEWNQVQTNTDQFFWQQMQCKEFVCRLCSHQCLVGSIQSRACCGLIRQEVKRNHKMSSQPVFTILHRPRCESRVCTNQTGLLFQE